MKILLAFTTLFLLVPFLNADEEKMTLYFSYITTITGNFIVSGGIPVVDWALELINSRTDILANYTLKYTPVQDSGVSQNIKILMRQ